MTLLNTHSTGTSSNKMEYGTLTAAGSQNIQHELFGWQRQSRHDMRNLQMILCSLIAGRKD